MTLCIGGVVVRCVWVVGCCLLFVVLFCSLFVVCALVIIGCWFVVVAYWLCVDVDAVRWCCWLLLFVIC